SSSSQAIKVFRIYGRSGAMAAFCKMPLALAAALLVPASSTAYNDELTPKNRIIIENLAEEKKLAERMPPCAALDYLSQAAFSYDAPPACPKARKVYEAIRKIDEAIR